MGRHTCDIARSIGSSYQWVVCHDTPTRWFTPTHGSPLDNSIMTRLNCGNKHGIARGATYTCIYYIHACNRVYDAYTCTRVAYAWNSNVIRSVARCSLGWTNTCNNKFGINDRSIFRSVFRSGPLR